MADIEAIPIPRSLPGALADDPRREPLWVHGSLTLNGKGKRRRVVMVERDGSQDRKVIEEKA